ncbi:hypothetical protein GP2143_16506 [marine gamma proteobacterium HTCC2143]|uniref:Uncharacterized protein n=1 Tax=marine gamma proteobacterium HTCC2143 TaxID=247633 RepID=A0Y9S1_9GAMM|nr:hypothetical protein GP2143_16506 [marine gamma proteobacterium HTCC2143]
MKPNGEEINVSLKIDALTIMAIVLGLGTVVTAALQVILV